MQIGVVTLFPDMIDALRGGGVTARALEAGGLSLACWNPRDYARDRHRSVDDRPYGGGPGMVMMAEPLREAIHVAKRALGKEAAAVYLSPQGRRLDQAMVRELAGRECLLLVCGRYEGVDERLVETEIDEEVSVGDFVLSGGELAAMVTIDCVARLLPGTLGHEDSAREDSFSEGLLDCPHYTRPVDIDGRRVPEVLLSGNHEAIRRWRLMQAVGRTWLRRPDMLDPERLSAERRRLLDEFLDENASDA